MGHRVDLGTFAAHLAATIQDGEAFDQLGRMDAGAVDIEALLGENTSVFCHGGDDATAGARALVDEKTKRGLSEQTWGQVREIFLEMPMLRDRFLAGAMEAP